ncbi:hypothetical protein ACFC6U_19370 [Kitasatospora purpeofusca]|uniref:hypothetical protein n=1 Tax=Kitasatospora purpeofusca TaxID=67352 RepID=UPI0035E03B6C
MADRPAGHRPARPAAAEEHPAVDLSAAARHARTTEAQLLSWFQEGTLIATPTPDGELDISTAEAQAARTRIKALRTREAARLHAEFRTAATAMVADLPPLTGSAEHVRWATTIRNHRLREALDVGVVHNRRSGEYEWMVGTFSYDPLLIGSIPDLQAPILGPPFPDGLTYQEPPRPDKDTDDPRPFFWPSQEEALHAVRTGLTDGNRTQALYWIRTRGLGGDWGTDPVDPDRPLEPIHYGGTTTYPWSVVRDSGAGSPRDHVRLYLAASGLDPDALNLNTLTAAYVDALTQHLPHDLTATGEGFIGTHRSNATDDIRTAYENADLATLVARYTPAL